MTSTRLLCTQTTNSVNATPGVPPNAATYYSATQGTVIDIPGDPASPAVQALLSHVEGYSAGNSLPASGPIFVLLGESGTTAQRPSLPERGQRFIDTTVGLLLTWDGASWRDVTGTSH